MIQRDRTQQSPRSGRCSPWSANRIGAAVSLAVAFIILATATTPAHAGCGCEKAPPEPTQVRPAALYPGGQVTIFHPGFLSGTSYEVEFISGTASAAISVTTEAVVRRDLADGVLRPQLVVNVPQMPLGPTAIRVSNELGEVVSLDDSAFTITPVPIPMPIAVGHFRLPEFQAAVSRDGTVYLSLDLTGVTQPRVFHAQAIGYPLVFTSDDVVFYNAQGFLMQLLDDGMPGLFSIAAGVDTDSDVLGYSRHEFNTYFLQHEERENHAVDKTDPNWHSNGTPHIDHDHLIIAINGWLRDGSVMQPGATPPFQLSVETETLFDHGIVGRTAVRLKNSAQTDSYHSEDETFESDGDIVTSGEIELKAKTTVRGNVVGAVLNIDKNATVTGSSSLTTGTFDHLPFEMPDRLEDLGAVMLTGDQTLELLPGSYRASEIVLLDDSRIDVDNDDGPVTIYVEGPLHLENKAKVTSSDKDPEKLAIYLTGSDPVILKNYAELFAVVYAPDSILEIGQSGRFFGAVVADEVVMRNEARFHYDTNLRGHHMSDGHHEHEAEVSSTDPNDSVSAPDTVAITKLKYKADKGQLKVRCESDDAAAVLTISIEDFVIAASMTHNAKKGRFEFKVETDLDLTGRLLTIVSDHGGQASAVLD